MKRIIQQKAKKGGFPMSLSRMVHTKRKASPTSQPSYDIFELQNEPLNKKGRGKEPSSTSLPQSLKSSPTKESKFIIINDDDDDDDDDCGGGGGDNISNSENTETNKDARSSSGSTKSVSPEKKNKNRPTITIIDDEDEDDDDIDQVLLFDGAEGCLLESASAPSKDNEEPCQFTPVIETQQRDLALVSSTQSEASQTKKLNTTPKKQSKSRKQESQPRKKTPSKSKSHRKRKSVITIKDDDDDGDDVNDDDGNEYIDDDDEDDDYNGRASIRSMFLKAACSQSTSSSSSTTSTTAKRSLSFNSKNDFSSHNPFQSTNQTQQVQRKSSSSSSTSSTSSTSALQNSIPEDKLFIDKYTPETSSELAVSDSTVKAFTEWASSPQFRSSRRILIISGPSGSGKTTMVRVVCKELGYSVIEYSPYGGTSRYDAEGNLYSVSPVDDFRSWVLRAAKGPSILTPDSALRFLVIEDFPFINSENSAKFRAVFADYLRFPKAMPMIIIVSDSERYYRRSGSSSSSKNMAYSIVTSFLLPTSEISPYVHSIKVNPVTLKKMRQALTKASAKCGVKMAMTTVNDIVQECGKDIRSALNMLQFSQSGFADRKINCRKDFELSLFHGAGKILHPRFKELLQDPQHQHHPPLQPQVAKKAKSYPEHFLLESTGVRPHQIVECAVENMYDFISEMDNLADALEAISLGDSIDGRRGRAKQVHGGAMKMSEEAQMLVAAYGIMNNITVESHKFYGIHAPKLRSMENLVKENSKALSTIFGEFVRKDDSFPYDGQQQQQQPSTPPPSWILSKYALLTEIIPFSGHLNSEKECFRIVKELNYSIPDEIISDK